jgi:hypothetical protein
MPNGVVREIGLGPLHTIGPAEARERAAAAVSFRRAADGCIGAHRAAWRNEKPAWRWTQTLDAHVSPLIGDLPVAAVDTGHVAPIRSAPGPCVPGLTRTCLPF